MNVSHKTFRRLDRATRHPSTASYYVIVSSILNELIDEMRASGEIDFDSAVDHEGRFIRFDEFNSLVIFYVAYLDDGRPILLRFDQWFVNAFVADARSELLDLLKSKGASDAAIKAVGGYLDDPTDDLPLLLCFDYDRPFDSFRQIFCAAACALTVKEKSHIGVVDRSRAFFEPSEIFERLGMNLQLNDKPEGRYHYIRRIFLPFAPADHQRLPAIFGERTPVAGHIFISLEVEKRSWLQQEEALSGLLSALREEVGDALRVVVNGMTAPLEGGVPPSFDAIDRREVEILTELKERAPKDTIFERTFGQTVKDKIEAALTCSFYVGPSASAGIVATMLGMPGIVYNNKTLINLLQPFDPPGTFRIAEDRVEDLPKLTGVAPKFAKLQNAGYSIDASYFIDAALDQYRKVVRAHGEVNR